MKTTEIKRRSYKLRQARGFNNITKTEYYKHVEVDKVFDLNIGKESADGNRLEITDPSEIAKFLDLYKQ